MIKARKIKVRSIENEEMIMVMTMRKTTIVKKIIMMMMMRMRIKTGNHIKI